MTLVGFGKMRPLKVIKYKSSVTQHVKFFCISFWSLFHIHFFFKVFCTCNQSVYNTQLLLGATRHSGAMIVPVPRVIGPFCASGW